MDVSRTDVLKAHEEILKGLNEKQKLRLSKEAEREMGKRSTYYLAKNVLQYTRLNDDFHVKLANTYDEWFGYNQFHIHPRGHFKTTIVNVSGNIRTVLNNPDISIAIMMNSMDNISKVIRETKGHFIHNQKFRDLYPEHRVRVTREEGTTTEFVTPARKKKWIRVPTFLGVSSDKAIVSLHYDYMIFDDIVDDKNVTSMELMDKVYQNYADSLSTVEDNKFGLPWHTVIGTPWHMFDTYARLRESNEKNPTFKFFRTAAEWNEEREDGTKVHKILFPEEFSQAKLDLLKEKQGWSRYSCLYLTDPIYEGMAAMDPEKLVFYDPKIKIVSPLNKCMTVDPSSSVKSRKGDPTVMGVYSMDQFSNIRVMDVLRDWLSLDDIVDKIIILHKLHNIRNIGIEAVAFQDWLCQALDKRIREETLNIKIHEIKRAPNVRKKNEGGRQERIIGFLNDGRVLVNKDLPQDIIDHIKREFREYPFGRYDDFMDTLTDAIDLLKPPTPPRKREIDYRMPPVTTKSQNPFQTGYSTRSSH